MRVRLESRQASRYARHAASSFFCGWRVLSAACGHLRDELALHVFDDRAVQLELVGEMVVERALGDLRAAHDLVGARVGIALLGEQLPRVLEEVAPGARRLRGAFALDWHTGGMLITYRRYVKKECVMPRFVIERELPGAGKLSPSELQAISQRSVNVLHSLGPTIQWVHSYVTDDKLYCVYNAPSRELVLEHARCGGFPANRVSVVSAIIDPVTAEAD